MAKNYSYQSAFDIIGPVVVGPSGSHTTSAVKIGNSARVTLGDTPKNTEIYYYESFAQTHQGHGADVAIVGEAMGYSTFDNRIKSSLKIVADDDTKVDIAEEEGGSIGQYLNCAYIKSFRSGGRYIEIIGISIGGGTVKIKGIHINGLEVDLSHGLLVLVVDGNMTRAQVNHFINDIDDMRLDYKDEFIVTDEDKCLVAIPLNKAISGSTLSTIKEEYSDVNVSYMN